MNANTPAHDLREVLARAGMYRTCDLETTGRHAAAVERARERIAAAAAQLNANDAVALANVVAELAAAPIAPDLFERMRARDDAVAAAALAGQWRREVTQ